MPELLSLLIVVARVPTLNASSTRSKTKIGHGIRKTVPPGIAALDQVCGVRFALDLSHQDEGLSIGAVQTRTRNRCLKIGTSSSTMTWNLGMEGTELHEGGGLLCASAVSARTDGGKGRNLEH